MIGIDITTTQNQFRYRGIGNVTKEIVSRWILEHPEEIVLFGFSTSSTIQIPKEVSFVDIGMSIALTPITKFKYKSGLYSRINTYISSSQGKKLKAFFSPFIHSGVPYNPKQYVTVCFVHDIIQATTGRYSLNPAINFMKKQQYMQDWKLLKYADRILTNSEVSKLDLESKFNLHQIDIVPLGVDISRFEQDQGIPEHKVPSKYILYYGGYEPNKNVSLLLEVFKKFKEQYDEQGYSLVCIGDGYEAYSSYASESIHFLGFVSDEEKIRLMQHADAYCNLSSYEGFGLSVLENMACGIPCLISDIPVYEEVYQDSALRMPIDSKEFNLTYAAELLKKIVDDKVLRDSLREKGLEKSRFYTWDNTYSKVRDILLQYER